MSSSVTAVVQRRGGYTVTLSPGVSAGPRFGTAPLRGAVNLNFADAVGGIEQLYRWDFSVPATTLQSKDLFTGGGEVDVANEAVALKQVRWIYIELTTPGPSTSLRFGPQNVTNAWAGRWGAAGATIYNVVTNVFDDSDLYDNWSAVDATHKVFSLYNPGAVAVAGTLLIAATKV